VLKLFRKKTIASSLIIPYHKIYSNLKELSKMTIGTLVALIILAIIGGAIAGLITKSLVVGIGFPVLLIAFFLMKKSLDRVKREAPTTSSEVEQKNDENMEEIPPVDNPQQ
jgi:hypothetical protein